MENIKIAFVQIPAACDPDANLKNGVEAVKKAKEEGADIVLFPELFNIGYVFPQTEDPMHDEEALEALKKLAIPANSPFVTTFRDLAKELSVAIAITYLEENEPRPRNTVSLFDRFGDEVYRYSKVHTCEFGDEALLSAGDDFYAEALDTEKGFIFVGSMICYDREFPESARILMLKGAELILVPNACPMEINRLSQLRGRAFENMTAIATCNYPAGQPDCNGHSTLFDGVAYLPDVPGSLDTCIMDAGEEAGIYYAELDVARLREYRTKEVHGNAYRHPEKYALLTDPMTEYPFVRKRVKN